MSTGQGIAGILMNFIQYLVLFFIGDIDIKNTEQQNDNKLWNGHNPFFQSLLYILNKKEKLNFDIY
jgi:hypothetical protein